MDDKRINLGILKSKVDIPDLIAIQRKSYDDFLQMDLLPAERKDIGIQGVFKSIFPIKDFSELTELRFISYSIGNWECNCGKEKGLENRRIKCSVCGHLHQPKPARIREFTCEGKGCRAVVQNILPKCKKCHSNVTLKVKYDLLECKDRGKTYSAPMKLKIQLLINKKDEESEIVALDRMIEQEIYIGDIPLMTNKGTFIINGAERVVVSQIQRSSGIFFYASKDKKASRLHTARIIPYRGSWIEFEFDKKGVIYCRIDKRRKIVASTLLKALGYENDEDIIRAVYDIEEIEIENHRPYSVLDEKIHYNRKLSYDIYDPAKPDNLLFSAGEDLDSAKIEKLKYYGINRIPIGAGELQGRYFASDVIDEETGEVLHKSKDTMDKPDKFLKNKNIKKIYLAKTDNQKLQDLLFLTLKKDAIQTKDEAQIDIYRRIRPGEPPNMEAVRLTIEGMFFDINRFDLGDVGRFKINQKFGFPEVDDESEENRVLKKEDVLETVKYLIYLWNREGSPDDIDHLGNRRVRRVGEILENQFRVGLVRMERVIKEKLNVQDVDTMAPHDIINAKPIMGIIREFFGSSQLCQFMDQTNPLAELTHKRRISALGPGGLSRDRAGFEVRDVHPTHYGRICPIETPEGPNIGLIVSLSTYANIDKYGFIQTPFFKVKNGEVQIHYIVIDSGDSKFRVDDIVEKSKFFAVNEKLESEGKRPAKGKIHPFYLNADQEFDMAIAQANARLDENGRLLDENINCTKNGSYVLVPKKEVNYIDISPKQLVSVSTALIPFLEHDDANRALMGSNMQRQAVPLISAEAPIVGTGMERMAAESSGALIICKRKGIIESVTADRIIVRIAEDARDIQGISDDSELQSDSKIDIYNLLKFKMSNQNTCINQRPIVKMGQEVYPGDILADGVSTEGGELALGKNILVALMPWEGFNYEDAIVLSERLAREDVFTSIHIEEFQIECRDTKLGPEEITADIPGVKEPLLRNLDKNGIIRIGAKVKPGDIIVGKVTPKGESQLSPEEKLLKAIFGEKAKDVKNASLICPPGVEGTVIEVKAFSRKGIEQEEDKTEEEIEIQKLEKDRTEELHNITKNTQDKLKKVYLRRVLSADLLDGKTGEVLIKSGTKLEEKDLDKLNLDNLLSLEVKDYDKIRNLVEEIKNNTEEQKHIIKTIFDSKIAKLSKSSELPPGVIKIIKVYIAMKRRVSAGDKIAGRHGNKGVISIILPEEDMPFLPDGTPVDIVLNPLGVPSRMNIGQILEAHIGWASKKLDLKVAVPVFESPGEARIDQYLKDAGINATGQSILYDGRTGDAFANEVTVGYMYIMKLHHLVDEKMHARSTGPYSLVTQQPLGGKAQFGGQRFGEMEVWALEAYGAAYNLQEMLTVKSDDVEGRKEIYESIVKGNVELTAGVPESFSVLLKELKSLCLDMELIEETAKN